MRLDLWILVVLGIAGVVFFLFKFNDSFPSASVDLRTPKRQIIEKAKVWSRLVGYSPDGAIESTVFSYDDDAKTFLEYELGQAKANDLMKNTIPVWMWRSRFCRAFQQEQCYVGMLTDGRIAYIDRSVPNDEKIESMSHADARKLAEDFVQKQAGISLAGTELIDEGDTKQLNRTDHYFNWKHLQPDFKDGKLYTYVNICGNQVTKYNHYLHVPEKFERKYAKMRSWNELLKRISSIIFVVLSASISFIFIWAFANGRIRWKLAIFAAVISGVLTVLNWLDDWPTLLSGYQTSSSLEQYIGRATLGMVAQTAYSMLQAFVFVGALEPIYRLLFPQKIALEKILTPLGLRTKAVFQGLVAGMSVFGVHTAYVVAFYLVGQKLGFWSPLDVRDASTLSHVSPVYDAMNVGVFASTMEELMYRVLCLAAFQWLTKNFWLANVLQAASWAFMHSDYPQEPAYVRGIELTIGGTFYGWVLRRFGLLATVLAHYTYDAFLGVTPLVVSSSLNDRLLCIVAILPGIIALAVSGFLIARKGINADEEPLENAALPLSQKPPPAKDIQPHEDLPYEPLSKRMRWILVAGSVICFACAALCKPMLVGHIERVTITRAQAVQIGEKYLGEHGVNTAGMRRLAWLTEASDPLELQYVFEKEGYKRTQELVRNVEPRLRWHVRFFKDSDPTEYYAILSSEGKPQSQYIVKDEEAPGQKLTEPQAEEAVQKFLKRDHGDLFPLELRGAPTVHDLPARRDYDVTYAAPQFKSGDAEFKVISGTVGSDVSGLETGWDIPDEWKFAREKKQNENKKISDALVYLLYGLSFGAILMWMVDVLRAHTIRWKAAIIFAAIAGAATLLHAVNAIPSVFTEYKTEEAIQTFVTGKIVDVMVSIVTSGAVMGLAAAFAYGAFHRMYQHSFASLVRPILPTGLGGAGSDRNLWLDAVLTAAALTIIGLGVDRILDTGTALTSPAVHAYSLANAAEFTDEWSLWIRTFISAISSGAFMPVFVAFLASFCSRWLRGNFWLVMLVSLVGMAILSSGAYYWQDFAWQVVNGAVFTAMIYFFIVRVARHNLLAYLLSGYFVVLTAQLLTTIKCGPQVYFGDIAVMIAALAAPFAYTIWLWAASSRLRS